MSLRFHSKDRSRGGGKVVFCWKPGKRESMQEESGGRASWIGDDKKEMKKDASKNER